MESERKAARVALPQKELSVAELASVLNVLAKEYHTTLPALVRKLDRVSGNLENLDRTYSGDNRYEWTEEEDALLNKNEQLLVRWKGQEAVDARKKYLQWKHKWYAQFIKKQIIDIVNCFCSSYSNTLSFKNLESRLFLCFLFGVESLLVVESVFITAWLLRRWSIAFIFCSTIRGMEDGFEFPVREEGENGSEEVISRTHTSNAKDKLISGYQIVDINAPLYSE